MKFLGDLIGAVGGLIGAGMEADSASDANALQYKMFKEGQEFNREMWKKSVDFNTEVMQNRHLWEVQDLRQAGLNPLMSVTSPTGTLSAPSVSSPAAGQAHKANTAASAAALGQMLGNLSIQDKMAEAAQTNADAAKISAQASETKADTEKSKFEWEKTDKWQKESQLIDAQVNNAISDSKMKDSVTARNDIENEWLPKIKEAELDEVQQRIAALAIVSAAQASYYYKAGDAALWNAKNGEIMAKTAEMLGISQSDLNYQNIEKVKKEMLGIEEDVERKSRENRYEEFNENSTYYRMTRFIGDTIDNLTGIRSFISK